MIYRSTHSDDSLWYLISCGKKTKRHLNAEFVHILNYGKNEKKSNRKVSFFKLAAF